MANAVTTHLGNNKTPYGGLSAAVLAIAIPFVSQWEGFYPRKYYDSVGVATICYGATSADGVDLSKTYTKEECQAMLGNDLPKYDQSVKKCLTNKAYAALSPPRHAAYISLSYNVGGGAFCKSSVVKDTNAGHMAQACDDMLAYNHGGGRVIQGLSNRRISECRLCLLDVTGAEGGEHCTYGR